MALGAHARGILRTVVGQALALALVGVTIGLAVAFALSRVLASALYDVSTTDPLTFVVVPLVLLAVAVSASYLPARRAASVRPIVALRYE
jgi:putative ABC transport system permease protein